MALAVRQPPVTHSFSPPAARSLFEGSPWHERGTTPSQGLFIENIDPSWTQVSVRVWVLERTGKEVQRCTLVKSELLGDQPQAALVSFPSANIAAEAMAQLHADCGWEHPVKFQDSPAEKDRRQALRQERMAALGCSWAPPLPFIGSPIRSSPNYLDCAVGPLPMGLPPSVPLQPCLLPWQPSGPCVDPAAYASPLSQGPLDCQPMQPAAAYGPPGPPAAWPCSSAFCSGAPMPQFFPQWPSPQPPMQLSLPGGPSASYSPLSQGPSSYQPVQPAAAYRALGPPAAGPYGSAPFPAGPMPQFRPQRPGPQPPMQPSLSADRPVPSPALAPQQLSEGSRASSARDHTPCPKERFSGVPPQGQPQGWPAFQGPDAVFAARPTVLFSSWLGDVTCQDVLAAIPKGLLAGDIKHMKEFRMAGHHSFTLLALSSPERVENLLRTCDSLALPKGLIPFEFNAADPPIMA